MSKYDQLGERLVAQDSPQVKMTFETVDGLVGGLPPSARTQRTWWANNSHGHALVWRAAGWHVSAVDLAGREVTFARGRAGGSHADRATQGSAGPSTTRKAHQSQAPLAMTPGQVVAETVTFTWHDVGPVTLDGAGKLTFPGPLPRQPGVYRLTLLADGKRSRVYIGESDSVLRRLGTNYRNPGSTQQTSLRVNAEVREHLATGGTVHLELTLEAFVYPEGGAPTPLDLRRKASRLLVENLALFRAHTDAEADLVNL